MVQWLSIWCRSQLWLRLDLWPENFHIWWVEGKKKKSYSESKKPFNKSVCYMIPFTGISHFIALQRYYDFFFNTN